MRSILFYQSLEKIKNFPNDTLIFPNEDSGLNNLIFARFLEPKNEFIDMRVFNNLIDKSSSRGKIKKLILCSNNFDLRKNDKSFSQMLSIIK